MRVLQVAAAALGLATAAGAQVLRVELRDSVLGVPVTGALVSAVDSTGAFGADGLSNDRGVVTLRLPRSGNWTVTVRRIGFTPRRVPDLRVADGATVRVPLALASVRQALPPVRVTAQAGTCGRAPYGDDRPAVLWERISFALRASSLSREDSTSALALQIEERARDLTPALEQRDARITRKAFGIARPYSAADPDTLASRGYVRADADGGISYFAPDETVLLSDAFLATHCFETPKKDADPALAELRFRPVRGRAVADVEGTAFVDTLSGELRRIEFRFIAPRALVPAPAKYAGGEVGLLRLPNGQWIVNSWAIRMPIFRRVSKVPQFELQGYREVGGTADPVTPPDA